MINSHRFIVKEIVQDFKRISLGTEPNYGIFILILINENVANSCPYRLPNVSFAESVLERRRRENYFRFHEYYTAWNRISPDKTLHTSHFSHKPAQTEEFHTEGTDGRHGAHGEGIMLTDTNAKDTLFYEISKFLNFLLTK